MQPVSYPTFLKATCTGAAAAAHGNTDDAAQLPVCLSWVVFDVGGGMSMVLNYQALLSHASSFDRDAGLTPVYPVPEFTFLVCIFFSSD